MKAGTLDKKRGPRSLRSRDPLQDSQHSVTVDPSEPGPNVTRRTALRCTFMGLFGGYIAGLLLEFASGEAQAGPINPNQTFVVEPNDIQFKPWQGLPPASGEMVVPKGRKAEDGRIDDRYQLVELLSSSYVARTKRNVEESGGTVIFSLESELSGGSELIRSHALQAGKPVIHIHGGGTEKNGAAFLTEVWQLRNFVDKNGIEVLNVAEPRESKEPGVYGFMLSNQR
jgi:Circularly permutated YpsA SLOG family